MGFITRTETTPGLPSVFLFSALLLFFFKYNIYIVCIYIFIFFISFFFNSEIKKQPAVMARDPEHVSKLTESTFKVSDAFNI